MLMTFLSVTSEILSSVGFAPLQNNLPYHCSNLKKLSKQTYGRCGLSLVHPYDEVQEWAG